MLGDSRRPDLCPRGSRVNGESCLVAQIPLLQSSRSSRLAEARAPSRLSPACGARGRPVSFTFTITFVLWEDIMQRKIDACHGKIVVLPSRGALIYNEALFTIP